MMMRWILTVLLFLLAGVVAGCGGGEAVEQNRPDMGSNHPEKIAKRIEKPGVVEAGDDQHVLEGKAVTLHASLLERGKSVTHYLWREGDDVLAEKRECRLVDLGRGVHHIALEAKSADGTVYVDHIKVVVLGDSGGDTLPEAQNLHFTTPEDVPFSGALRGSDSDGDPLHYVLVSLPEHGRLSGSAAHLHYIPDPDFYGEDSFLFKTNDGKIDSDLATVTITVEPRNDAPVAEAMQLQTEQESPVTAALQASDKEGDSLSFVITQQPSHGSVTLHGGEVTYVPRNGFSGEDSFGYKANDGREDSDEATVTVTVTHVNHAPQISDMVMQTNEDTALEFPLSAEDSDGDAVTFRLTSAPKLGRATISGNLLHYQPDPDRFGTERFTYVANDGHVDSSPATVTIHIAAQNDAPVASPLTLTTDEDQPATITLQATDTENDPLTFAIVTQPQHGSVTMMDNHATYTPDADYHGTDTFTYKATDGIDDSAAATVSVTVNSVNDLPQLSDMTLTTQQDQPLSVTLSATDPDNDPLTFLHGTPAHGTLSGSGANLTYTPQSGFSGTDTFTYRVNDTHADSAVHTVTITVTAIPNSAPVVTDQNSTSDEDSSVAITLHGSDADNDTLTFAITSAPLHGSVTLSGAVATYTPQPNYNGRDSFTFMANDGTADSNVATVNLQINPVNDRPTATPQNLSGNEDSNLTITLTGDDIDGDTLQDFTVVTQPVHGTLSCSGILCTYAPFANFSGSDLFTYSVSDGTLTSDPATVTLIVNPQNDAPVAISATKTVPEDSLIVIPLDATDVENDSLTYTLVAAPQHGTAVLDTNSVTYTPAADYHGSDSFTFKANDGTADSNVATVRLTVTPVNDAPTATPQSLSTDEDTNLSITLGGSDIDGDSLTYTIATPPAHGTLSGTAPALTYTPDPNFNGGDVFSYTVSDGAATSAEANVTIMVNSINDAPVAVAGNDMVIRAGASVTLDGSGSNDPDGSITAWEWKEGSIQLATTASFTKTDFTTGTHILTLTVTDDSGATATDTVTVTVNPASALSFTKHLLLEQMNKPEAVFCADIDGDGYNDILTADSGTGDNRWLQNERNKSFDTTKPYIRDNNQWTESIYAADIDGDGDIDVLPGSYGGGNIPTLAWYENDGKTNFTEHEITVSVADAAFTRTVDLDGDGDVDILVGSWSDNNQNGSVRWYENDGSQNFTEHTITSGRTHIRTVATADIDGDGDLDLVAAEYGDGKVAWFENDGSQNFTEHVLDTTTPNIYSVTTGDFDGDGYTDIVSSPDGNGLLYWFRNNHDKTFTAHQLQVGTVSNEYGDIKKGDFDNDGDFDLLYSAYDEGEIGLFRNDGSGNFTKEVVATGVKNPSTMYVADLDFDGDLDFAIALFGEKEFAWYENGLLSGPGYRLLPKTGDSGDGGFGGDANLTRDADAIVTDHLSGLMWADDATAVANVAYWSSAESVCRDMTTGGYSDWRIPKLHELYYLLDRAQAAPQIDTVFQNVATDDGYWNYEYTNFSKYGWIDFNTAQSNVVSISSFPKKHIRCVRGEPIRFHLIRDDANSVVMDYQHDLMWEDSTAAVGNAVSFTEAENVCISLTTGGYNDWRMPNINELYAAGAISGVDLRFHKAFVNKSAAIYWSATQDGNGNYDVLDFGSTYDDAVLAPDQTAKVRCVRNIH